MSSFIGVVGGDKSIKEKIRQLLPEPDFSFQNQSLFIHADVNPQTTHVFKNETNDSGWIVCGIGISQGEHARVLSKKEWGTSFEENVDLQAELDGHFAIAKWDGNTVELFTDQIGMRNIFIHRNKERTLFSTRLDWMIKLIQDTSINWHQFGSNWLGINPFSSGCLINKIDRLAQDGRASISEAGYSFSNTRWSPKYPDDPSDINRALKSVSRAALNTFSETSLGLSGGLDSRVLFGSLLGQNSDQWGIYTFDNSGHPDVEIAKQLNQPFGKTHHMLPVKLPEADEIINKMGELALRSQFTTSIAALPNHSMYGQLGKEKRITIDGAFGEIGRRRFLRGVELREKDRIIQWSAERLLPYFNQAKADIFTPEIIQTMEQGLTEGFEKEFETMPPVKELGIANWLDLFTIRTRAQNLFGPKQGISDELLFHYMPFIQPSFLNTVFITPEKLRTNATLFRSLIKWNAPELTKVNLVKGDDTYPYWMKDISAMAWMRLKNKMGLGFKNTTHIKLILSLEEYVLDTINSRQFKECAYYDFAKIEALAHQFYTDKDYSKASQLSWFINFEILRNSIQ